MGKFRRVSKVIFYQSTLERYNPLIKFCKKNIDQVNIAKIESYRYGIQPSKNYTSDPKFDLGIHDVDLWFYLFNKKVFWQVNVGYGKPRREIFIYFKNGNLLRLDLLNKLMKN